ncbi:MAG: ergothioneine biosynthesis protein EgtB [Caulobacteraceae bacterium]
MRRYAAVRAHTLDLAQPLSAEDQQVQSMPDVSPTKWHLAHASWFFETFLLAPSLPAIGSSTRSTASCSTPTTRRSARAWSRPERGLLSRPSLEDVLAYRRYVDEAVDRLVATLPAEDWADLQPLFDLGLNHEQQHQELILMDIKHVLSLTPCPRSTPRPPTPNPPNVAPPSQWLLYEGGLVEIGHDGPNLDDAGFAFDNEGPPPPRLARTLRPGQPPVHLRRIPRFHRRRRLWPARPVARGRLGRGPARGLAGPALLARAAGRVLAPVHLHGERALDPEEPVGHLSFYEADAFARWSGRRLPTEAEWETAALAAAKAGAAAKPVSSEGPFLFHPRPALPISGLQQMSGDLWQWTASAYSPYPRYRPAAGAIGEYNASFMSGQMVLRGGCVATPEGHARPTYRNFFPPASRWAFSGVRLADDA